MKNWKKFKFSMPHVFTMLFGILMVLGVLSLILSYADVGPSKKKEVEESFTVTFSENVDRTGSEASFAKLEAKIATNKAKAAAKQVKEKDLIGQFIASSYAPLIALKEEIIAFRTEGDPTAELLLEEEGGFKTGSTLKAKFDGFKTGYTTFKANNIYKAEELEKRFAGYDKAKEALDKKATLTLTNAGDKANVKTLLDKIDTEWVQLNEKANTDSFMVYFSLINSEFIWAEEADQDGKTYYETIVTNNDVVQDLEAKAFTLSKEFVLTEDIKILGAGILDWFTAIPFGINDAFWVIIFLFVLGGFINVVIKSQALEALIGKISTKFHTSYKKIKYEDFVTKNSSNGMTLQSTQNKISYYCAHFKEAIRQTWVIIPLMLFFSFAGTTYGMAEESLAFYAIIIPLALAAGFDVYTGFLIIFAGAGAGVMGSTINPFSILTAVNATKDSGVDTLKVSDGVAWRWVGWVLFTSVTIGFVMWYAARVKRDKEKSYLKDLFEIHKQTFQQAKVGELAPTLTRRRLATVVVFMFTFVFMVFAMLNYDSMESLKDTTPFEKAEADGFENKKTTSWFHNSVVTSGMGEWTFWVFGNWYFESLTAYFLIVSLVLAAINWKGEKRYMSDMTEGAKDMMGVALAVGVARAISVLLKHTNMQTYFVEKLSEAIKDSKGDKNITIPLFSYIIFIPLTFFIPSTSGLANASFPILGPAVNNAAPEAVSGTITAYGWAAGLANMVVPTYGVVIGALAITKIPYNKFLRAFWKYLLIMFLIGFFMIVIGGAAGSSVF